MATYRRELPLADATLTDLAIAPAEAGLPERLELDWDTVAFILSLAPVHYYPLGTQGYVTQPDLGSVPRDWTSQPSYASGPLVAGALRSVRPLSEQHYWTTHNLVNGQPPIAYDPSFDFGAGAPMTLSLWFFDTNGYSGGNIMGNGPNYANGNGPGVPGDHGWLLYAIPSQHRIRLHFYEAGGNVVWAEFPLSGYYPPNGIYPNGFDFHHYIFTWDGGTGAAGIRCWLDGVEQTQTANSGAAVLALSLQHPTYGWAMLVGPDAWGNLATGWMEMAHVAIWDRVLDSNEVTQLAAQGKASFGTAHWDVNLPGATAIRDVVVPGDGADFSSTTRVIHQTKVNLITSPSGRVDNLRPNVDQNLAVDSAIVGVEVELYASSPEVPADPWVGGPNGEGPVVIYEAPDPDAVQVSFAPLTIQRPGILAATQVRSGILAADTQPAVIIEGD